MRRIICVSLALIALSATFVKAGALGPINVGSLVVLLSDEGVRDSLHLTKSQRSELDSQRSAFRTDARRLVANEQSGKISGPTAGTKLTALLKQTNKQAYGVLTPTQQSQLIKQQSKVLGNTLLLSETVQNKLGLSAQQKAQITAIHTQTRRNNDSVRTLYHSGQIGHFQKISRLRVNRKKEGKLLVKVLTPAQQAAFKKLAS
ncbi:MAG: hypothetical protein ABI443_13085 [Chthoniobacterales bacterium]